MTKRRGGVYIQGTDQAVMVQDALEPGEHDVPGTTIGTRDGINIRKAQNGWLITVYKYDSKNHRQEDTLWVCAQDKLLETLTVAMVQSALAGP